MPVKTLKRSFQSFLIRPNSTLFEGYTYGTFFYRCVNLTDNLPFFFFYILPWQSSLTESDTLEVLDSHKVLHHLYFCCLHLKIDYSEFSGVPQNTVITSSGSSLSVPSPTFACRALKHVLVFLIWGSLEPDRLIYSALNNPQSLCLSP